MTTRGERIGPALVIEIASPEYVLAMKSRTTRKSDGDLADAVYLCKLLGYGTRRNSKRS